MKPPESKDENVSKSMKGNKGKDTGPELLLRRKLREAGLTGYKLNWNKIPGRPDVCFTRYRLAIFVHGCFWHRCPHCDLPTPKNNRDYWEDKFRKNTERDRKKEDDLKSLGWDVITVWECELKKDADHIVASIGRKLHEKGRRES